MEAKQFYNVRKQIQLMQTSPQVNVELLILVEDSHLQNSRHLLILLL